MIERCLTGMDWDSSILVEYAIPYHLHEGLVRYLKNGIMPGGFLTAILTNNLMETVVRAHPQTTLAFLPGIISFLCNEVSANVWGSEEAVKNHVVQMNM